jgi:S1-C subfamily serine protease
METGNELVRFSEQIADLVEAASACVVQVRGRHARPRTGTLIAPSRVMTAYHLQRPDEVRVQTADGGELPARFEGADPSSGLSTLQVEGLDGTPMQVNSPARTGQIAIALARTWSGALVASAGIIAAVGGPLRTGRGPAIEQVVRADVRMHPLGIGGPLVGAAGEVLAISSGGTIRGLPMFVPAGIALRIAEAIATGGGIRRGYLGINALSVRLSPRQAPGLQQTNALLVAGVAGDSPAERSGILVGDLILRFDQHNVEDHDDLLDMLTGERIGRTVPVDIVRGGMARTLQVSIGQSE